LNSKEGDMLPAADGPEAMQGLPARINLCATGGADFGALQAALRRLGLPVVTESADLLVAVCADLLDAELAILNAACLEKRRPWLLVRPGGIHAAIGPLFLPGETACWECLAHRLRETRQAQTWLGHRRRGRPPRAPDAGTSASDGMAVELAATAVLRLATAGTHPALINRMLTLDTRQLALQPHGMVRRPQCLACAGQAPRVVAPLLLDPGLQPTHEPDDGGNLEAFVDPLTGVVQRVEPGTPTDHPLVHTARATHFFPVFNDKVRVLEQNLAGRAGGKGRSAAEARAGAIGEALERYSGIWQSDWDPSLHASTRSLGEAAVPLEACLMFSAAQYAGRVAWNRALRGPRQFVPAPLDPAAEIDWTPAWSLTCGRVRYVAAAHCWFGHPDLARLFCIADSNGCAAAGTPERAILSGLIELIERDAVAMWWYNRTLRPGVDLRSFADPYLDSVCDHYHALGRDVWALDVSADLGLPVVAVLSARRDSPVEDIIFGFAADLDAKRAVVRAMTEMNQSYSLVSERLPSGETCYRGGDGEMLYWLRTATRAREPWLLPGRVPHRAGDFVPAPWTDATAAVHGLVAQLEHQGLETLVVDQTRPDLGLPVMRVIVPGLRHLARRLAPGRLLQVPAQLGWIDRPLTEAELNPYSIFL
jgi:oxazoline/thiazoline synthase